MKIFLAGSTLSFERRKDDYVLARQTILDIGFSIAHDWVKDELEGNNQSSWVERWDFVQKALKEADASILDITVMDAIAGEHLALLVERKIPLLLLIDASEKNIPDSPLTDYFISKDHLQYIKKETYTKENLRKIITDFLDWVKKNKRIVRFNLEIEKGLDDYLKEQARTHKTSKSEEIRRLILEEKEK